MHIRQFRRSPEAINNLPRAVAHCFTGEKAELHAYLDLGLYIGITGWICDERRGAPPARAACATFPRDRLMLETDSPYLTPRDMRPQPKARRNEPALPAARPAHHCAGARQAAEQVAEETTRNAQALLRPAVNIVQFLLQSARRLPGQPALAVGGQTVLQLR